MTYSRGSVWYAEIPGIGDKPVIIVSAEMINRSLANVTVARVTSVKRERSLPTFVALDPSEISGLPDRSYAICHDLFTLPKTLMRRNVGLLPPHRMLGVEAALRRALDL